MTTDENVKDANPPLNNTPIHVSQAMAGYTDAERKYNNSEMRLNRKRLQAGDLVNFFSNLTALCDVIEIDLLPAADEMSQAGLSIIGIYIPLVSTCITEISGLIACITFFRRYQRNKDKIQNLILLIEECKQFLDAKAEEINQQQAELEILLQQLLVTDSSAVNLQIIYDKFNKLAQNLTDYFNILDHLYYLVDLQTIIESAYRIGWANFITSLAVGIATILFTPVGGVLVSQVSKAVRSLVPQGCGLFKKTTATLNLKKNFSQRYEIKDTAICNFVARLDMNIEMLENNSSLPIKIPVSTEPPLTSLPNNPTTLPEKINPHYISLKKQLVTYRTKIQEKKSDFEARKNNSGKVGRGIYRGKRRIALGGTIIFAIGIIMLFVPFPGPQFLAPLLILLGDAMMTMGNAEAIYSRNQISLQGPLKTPTFLPPALPETPITQALPPPMSSSTPILVATT